MASTEAEPGIAANEPRASWWWNGQSADGTVGHVQILGRLMAGFDRSSNGNDLLLADVAEYHQALLATTLDHFREGVPRVAFAGHLGFWDHRPLAICELFLEPASASLGVVDESDRNG